MIRTTFSAAMLLVAANALAIPVTQTAGTSAQQLMEDFSTVPAGASASFDGNGVTVAETFVGLAVIDPGGTGHETFAGNPTPPLTLNIGAASTGIWQIQGVAGLAGGVGADDIGEGVIAFLFDFDILELGLTVNGSNGGAMSYFFYGSNGTLLDVITSTLAGEMTFTSTVAFRGLGISNVDLGGVAYDDFRFSAAAVPEPGSLVLLGIGLMGWAWHRRLLAERRYFR